MREEEESGRQIRTQKREKEVCGKEKDRGGRSFGGKREPSLDGFSNRKIGQIQ